jgi:hypothetical protein
LEDLGALTKVYRRADEVLTTLNVRTDAMPPKREDSRAGTPTVQGTIAASNNGFAGRGSTPPWNVDP